MLFSTATAGANKCAGPEPTLTRGPAVGIGARIVLVAIRIYKLTFSPLYAGSCRFTPGCADYMTQAVTRFGAVRGVWLGVKRLSRCRPFGGHGFDPVPDQFDHQLDHQITRSPDHQLDH